MKSPKKIFLSAFLLVFLVSNTGLPLTLHLCQMMNEVSMESCEMCSVHKTCCSDVAGPVISKEPVKCCETKNAAEPLKDRYITAKEVSTTLFTDIAILVIADFAVTSEEKRQQFISDISPPEIFTDALFILNSSFLI